MLETLLPSAAADSLVPHKELASWVASRADRPKLERIEARLLAHPVQAEHELKHSFAPGVYLREILMLKDTILIGHEHKFEHFNIILSGKALVFMEGEVKEIVAPCYFKSGAGVQKVLYIIEDMRWMTVHANQEEERDIDKLEDTLITKSETFRSFEALTAQEHFKKHLEQFKPRKEEIL